MRFTPRLYGEFRKGFWFKNIWKTKSQAKLAALKVPTALQEAGIEPLDIMKEIKEKKKIPVWIPPEDPRFMFPPSEEDHPDYHAEMAYTISDTVRLWEGLKQAQVLTNTLVTHNLPDSILAKADELQTDDQDHYMQRAILQAHLWDTARERLPPRKKPDDIKLWKYKTEYGIPPRRIVEILLRKITHQCGMKLSINDLQSSLSRRVVEGHQMNGYFEFDNHKIYVTSDTKLLLTAANPVPSYASPEEVKEAVDYKFPDMYPVSPLVDLDKSHIYKESSNLGLSPEHGFRRHHTLFLEYPREWTMDMRHANALIMSYVHSLAIAREFKLETQMISEPVCVQTVHTDGEVFGYTCFQLNTLMSSTEAASKDYATRRNMAWVDSDALFDKHVPRRSMLRETKYTDYNSQVFRKILGLYCR